MADDNKSKSKSKSKGTKRNLDNRDVSSSDNDSSSGLESIQSQSAALHMKRKHVYDSLEHCRAVRSQSTSKDNQSTSASSPITNKSLQVATKETPKDTVEYIEALKSNSTSRSGRYHDTSIEGKPTNLKITTWNINGLRSWLKKRSGLTFIAQDDADIYCFQETKCDSSSLPDEIKNVPGYKCYWNGSNDKHSGVACFAKKEPLNVSYGIGSSIYDREGRVITLEYADCFVINVYVPNSGRKLVRLDYRKKWDVAFYDYVKRLDSQKAVVLCGDMNVCDQEIDLANPKANSRTAGFTAEERENFRRFLEDLSLVDVFRYLNPVKKGCYTYWTFMRNARERNIGWRLDYFIISRRWLDKTCDCIIRNDVYGSDHCPVSIYLAV